MEKGRRKQEYQDNERHYGIHQQKKTKRRVQTANAEKFRAVEAGEVE